MLAFVGVGREEDDEPEAFLRGWTPTLAGEGLGADIANASTVSIFIDKGEKKKEKEKEKKKIRFSYKERLERGR